LKGFNHLLFNRVAVAYRLATGCRQHSRLQPQGLQEKRRHVDMSTHKKQFKNKLSSFNKKSCKT